MVGMVVVLSSNLQRHITQKLRRKRSCNSSSSSSPAAEVGLDKRERAGCSNLPLHTNRPNNNNSNNSTYNNSSSKTSCEFSFKASKISLVLLCHRTRRVTDCDPAVTIVSSSPSSNHPHSTTKSSSFSRSATRYNRPQSS